LENSATDNVKAGSETRLKVSFLSIYGSGFAATATVSIAPPLSTAGRSGEPLPMTRAALYAITAETAELAGKIHAESSRPGVAPTSMTS